MGMVLYFPEVLFRALAQERFTLEIMQPLLGDKKWLLLSLLGILTKK